MLYDIRQTTTYSYRTAVPMSRHTIRMQPRSRDGQRVIASTLTIAPPPANRHDSVDFFGNATTSALIADPHVELSVTTRARVETLSAPSQTQSPSWGEVRIRAPLAQTLGPQSPVHFIFPTPHVPVWGATADYCRPSFTEARPIIEAAAELAERMHADFKYDPTVSDVFTPVASSFSARAGVCQDFAHIMISGLRTLGIPAAYVSGYLRTDPPPGKPRIEGADAMHAWVDVWCGEDAGWQGFDPTNGARIDDRHITLAVGRDYSDVSPIVGALKTSGRHVISVGVDVVPVTN